MKLDAQRMCYKVQGPSEMAELSERVQVFCNGSEKYLPVGIQKILYCTTEDDRLCLHWENFEGKTLADEYSNHRHMPLDELRDCLQQIVWQLDALLDNGFPPRDLHPGTILRRSLHEKITQHNPALKPSYTLTVSSIFSKLSELTPDAYTCLHLAPEELSAIQRDPRTPVSQPGALSANDVSSARACVYKLALLLYVLLTGNASPFDKTETQPSQIIMQKLHYTPILRGLQKQLRPLFLRALSVDPAQRPTLDEFCREFEEACEKIIAPDKRHGQPKRVSNPPMHVPVGQIGAQRVGFRWADILTQNWTRRKAIKAIVATIAGFTTGGFLLNRLRGSVGDTLLSFTKHTGTVNALSPSPDGQLILSADQSGRLIVWDATTGINLLNDKEQHNQVPIRAVAWWKNSQIFASLDDDGVVWLWRLHQDGQYSPFAPSRTFTKPTKAIAFSPTGDHLVVGSDDDLFVFDFAPNNPFGNPDPGYEGRSEEANGINSVNSIAIARDGSFGASSWNDTTTRTWNVDNAEQIIIYQGHSAAVSTVAISPDGRWVASGGEDRSVQVWDAQHGSVQVLYHHDDTVCAIGWSPDGQYIASGGEDNVVRIYDMNNNPVYKSSQFQADVSTIAWLPRQRIASSVGSQITIWRSP